MAFFGAALDLGIAIFLVAALAEHAKLGSKLEKSFSFFAAAGVLFVLQAAFGTFAGAAFGIPDLTALVNIFNIVGVLFVFVGSLFAVQKLVTQ